MQCECGQVVTWIWEEKLGAQPEVQHVAFLLYSRNGWTPASVDPSPNATSSCFLWNAATGHSARRTVAKM